MARELTPGQRAAVRAAVARRGELGLSQAALAERSGVSARAIANFEVYDSWPQTRTRHLLEKHGLGWPIGHLEELADRVDYPAEQPEDDFLREDVDQVWSVLEDAERRHGPRLREEIERRLARLRAEKGVGRSDDGDTARTDRTRRPGVRGA